MFSYVKDLKLDILHKLSYLE